MENGTAALSKWDFLHFAPSLDLPFSLSLLKYFRKFYSTSYNLSMCFFLSLSLSLSLSGIAFYKMEKIAAFFSSPLIHN